MDRARTIADRSVQDHYRNDFRRRLQDAFADYSPVSGARRRLDYANRQRPGAGWQGRGSNTAWGRGAARLASDPLLGSEDGRAEARERVLLASILNHPDLLAEVADAFAQVEIGSHVLDGLRQAILDVASHHGGALDAGVLAAALRERGFARLVDGLAGPSARVIDWFARPGAAREDVLTGFRQVLALHQRFGGLRAEIDAGAEALGADMTEAQWERFRALKAEEAGREAFEAEIDDFGTASGRKPEV
jgi:DNA primase